MNNYNPYYSNPYVTSLNIYAYVNGLEGAKAYQAAPNQNVLLIDSENPVIYMKSTNAMGQGSIQCFKITQINENEIRPNVTSGSNYVLKDDFSSLIKRIEQLEQKEK